MADTSTITKTNVCFLKEIMAVTIWPLVNDDLKKTNAQCVSVNCIHSAHTHSYGHFRVNSQPYPAWVMTVDCGNQTSWRKLT